MLRVLCCMSGMMAAGGGENRPDRARGTVRPLQYRLKTTVDVMQAEECRVLHRRNDRTPTPYILAFIPLCIINLSSVRCIDSVLAFFLFPKTFRDRGWNDSTRGKIPRKFFSRFVLERGAKDR